MIFNIPPVVRAPASHMYATIRGLRLTAPNDEEYRKYCTTLGVKAGCEQEDVRRAFVSLAKQYHPDSDSPSKSAEKFREIEHAYRMLKNKTKEGNSTGWEADGTYCDENPTKSNVEVQEFDIKHTAPQHRQYLSFEGKGIGSPWERQRQHQKIKAATAMEDVFNHKIARIQKLLDDAIEPLEKENSLTVQDKKSQDEETRYSLERRIEEMIQESMARGEFDNLRGSGKPLKQYNEHNPYVDFSTHKMNQIMIDNGFMPTWITLQKEIRAESAHIRSVLEQERSKYGSYPLTEKEEKLWTECVETMEEDAEKLNKKIGKFNIVVPILNKQMLLFDLKRESEKILIEGEAAVQPPDSCAAEELNSQGKDTVGTISGLISTVLQRVSRS